jgi:hypothetical protein
MVIITLKGGLGNQLFQYAFGRRIALERNEQLYFNIRPLVSNSDRATPRDFKLEGLPDTIIANEEHAAVFNDLFFGTHEAVIIGDDNIPKEEISSTINDSKMKAILIDGYFQDEFYFAPYKELIRKEFQTFLNKYYDNSGLPDDLVSAEQDTLAVHVRRTDYLEPAKMLVHGICEMDYYKEALEVISSKLTVPKYFLFSDDPIEAERLFDGVLLEKTNISALLEKTPSKDNDIIELALMTKCKNFILANSSFSWWGSYLSDADPKLVIAPKKWLLSKELKNRAESIALPFWIRI